MKAAGFIACSLLRFGTCFSWACLLLGHLAGREKLKQAALWACASAPTHQLVQTPQDSPGGQEVGAAFSGASSSLLRQSSRSRSSCLTSRWTVKACWSVNT